jgi:Uma2 family endonuclease
MSHAVMNNADARMSAPLRLNEQEYEVWAFAQEFETEWVDGEVIMMSPISSKHDDLQAWLRMFLQTYCRRKKLGRVKGPEFQIRLPRPSRREPDVLFISEARVGDLRRTYFAGAPDLAIEIVSPESESRDWREKYLEYEAAGVREYWIVDPMSQRVEAYTLQDGKYQLIPAREDKIVSSVVPGWYVKPQWLWQEELPDVLEILAELGIK